MPTEVDRNRRFRRSMTAILVVVLTLCTLSVIRTGQVQSSNSRLISRNSHIEAEIQDIIAQGKLGCPDRATARHILRTSILEDPDTSPELRALTLSDFPEIVCTP